MGSDAANKISEHNINTFLLLTFHKFVEPYRCYKIKMDSDVHDSDTQDCFIRANQSLKFRYNCTIYSLLVNLELLSIAHTIYYLMTGLRNLITG